MSNNVFESNDIMSNYFNNLYQNESIYILNYPNGTDVYTSNGILYDIKGIKIIINVM